MSIKEKLAALVFGKKVEEAPAQEPNTEAAAAEENVQEPLDAVPSNPSLLELPAEHQLYRLYNQRRQEAGYIPAPRLCLDEDGSLPPETVQKELIRLKSALTSACSARIKSAKGQSGGRGKHKKEDGEPEDDTLDLDALPYFFLSADKLLAWVMVFPPVGRGQELSRDMLYRALDAHGICCGVDAHLADRLSHSDGKYFNLYLIAKGKPAFDGKNGNLVDNFPRVIARVLEVDEHDQVDYTALNLIHNVDQGQEICRLIKPTEGEPGRSVLGHEIPAKSGKSVPLPKGRNTEISKDGTQLLASIAGSVEFTGRSFQVKPVLDIPEDVDFSTGSINFLGDINIQGNVLSGFTVRAMGNIRIAGVVEAGSTIEAGGDLVVAKGILGDGTTTIQACKSVFSKYVQNATVCVRENLQTDCIIGSSIFCGGEVVVKSGRGSIIGGQVWAAQKIRANIVGSQSECKTTVSLGGAPCSSFEREMTQRETNALEMALEKLECQPDSPTKSSLLSKTKIRLAAARMKLKQLEESGEALQAERGAEEKETGRLECGIAYPGTKIRFGDEVLRLHHTSRQCIAVLADGEILLM